MTSGNEVKIEKNAGLVVGSRISTAIVQSTISKANRIHFDLDDPSEFQSRSSNYQCSIYTPLAYISVIV